LLEDRITFAVRDPEKILPRHGRAGINLDIAPRRSNHDRSNTDPDGNADQKRHKWQSHLDGIIRSSATRPLKHTT
jgi:hypothetical protein